MRNSVPTIETHNILSRRDYQEILLARMAGGDLFAHEELIRILDILPSLKERDSGVIGSSLRCRSYATSPQSRCPDS